MTVTLYYAPNTRANRPRWVLEELGIPYQLVRLSLTDQDHKQPGYLRIHPLGKVPALTDGDITMFETGAICIYLADKYPDAGLAPAPHGSLRAPYLQWIFYATTTLEPPLLDYYFETQGKPADRRDPAHAARARARFDTAAEVVAHALADRTYLLGDHFTTADIMIGAALGWARAFDVLSTHPRLIEYGRLVGNRPAAKASRT